MSVSNQLRSQTLSPGNPLQFSVLLKNTAGMHWIGELGFQDATIKSEFHVPRLQK
jgi:hypothetical protein